MTSKYTPQGLEEKVDELDTKLQLILTNHLPHISQDMEAVKVRINVFTLVNIGGIILGLIAAKFL